MARMTSRSAGPDSLTGQMDEFCHSRFGELNSRCACSDSGLSLGNWGRCFASLESRTDFFRCCRKSYSYYFIKAITIYILDVKFY